MATAQEVEQLLQMELEAAIHGLRLVASNCITISDGLGSEKFDLELLEATEELMALIVATLTR